MYHKELIPHQKEVTEVNQQGNVLTERCRHEDSDLVAAQLEEVNMRWDDLCNQTNERQQKLEEALLQLGQFQLALEELLVWLKQTDKNLDEQLAKPVQGDVKYIEIELAKHKVILGAVRMRSIDYQVHRYLRISIQFLYLNTKHVTSSTEPAFSQTAINDSSSEINFSNTFIGWRIIHIARAPSYRKSSLKLNINIFLLSLITTARYSNGAAQRDRTESMNTCYVLCYMLYWFFSLPVFAV